MSGDPTRLLDDPGVGSLLRGDLATASAAQVQGLDHAAGLGALQAALGGSTGAIPVVASAGAGGSIAAKILLGAALLGGIGGVTWWAKSQSDAPAVDPVPAPVVSVASDPEPPRAPASQAASVPASPEPALGEPASVPEEDPADPALDLEPSVPLPPSEPKNPRASTRSDSRGATSEALDDAVVREARQIQAARRALATDAARALSLTHSIAEEFPRGQLVEERLAIAIRALAKLGRIEEARTNAEAFLESYGRGAHATAVRRAVGL